MDTKRGKPRLIVAVRIGDIAFKNCTIAKDDCTIARDDLYPNRNSKDEKRKEIFYNVDQVALTGDTKMITVFHTEFCERLQIPIESNIKKGTEQEFKFYLAEKAYKTETERKGGIYQFRKNGGFKLMLHTNVISEDHQLCVKLEGESPILELSTLDEGTKTRFYNIHCRNSSLAEYYPEADNLKMVVSWFEIEILKREFEFEIRKTTESDRRKTDGIITKSTEPKNPQSQTKTDFNPFSKLDPVREFVSKELYPFFSEDGECSIKRASGFFRMIVPTKHGKIGVYNAYLHYMLHSNTPHFGPDRLRNLFDAALARHPELLDFETFKIIVDIRFSNPNDSILSESEVRRTADVVSNSKQGASKFIRLFEACNLDFRYLFVKAIQVVIDLLVVYDNAVPYLSDTERLSKADYGSRKSKRLPFQQRWEMDHQFVDSEPKQRNRSTNSHKNYSPNSVCVERFFNPTSGFGHDCEDGATYSMFLHSVIMKDYYEIVKLRLEKLSDPLIVCVGKVLELFSACLCAIYAKVPPQNYVLHISLLLVPRFYLYQAKLRGRNDFPDLWLTENDPNVKGTVSWSPESPGGVREWEKNPDYYGCFVAEGTTPEDSAKFSFSPIADSQRNFYSKNINSILDTLDSLDAPKNFIDRVLVNRKTGMNDLRKPDSFFVSVNAFDQIDSGRNLKEMKQLGKNPETTSFVICYSPGDGKRKRVGRHPYGVDFADLIERKSDISCYPIAPFSGTNGKVAFDMSIKDMKTCWPPMTLPPISDKIYPDFLTVFENEITKREALVPLFEAKISLASTQTNSCCPIAQYTRFHIPMVDIQTYAFTKKLGDRLEHLVENRMYYALRLKINYISDAQMFPLLLPTKSTKEKTGIPDSVTYFHNFIYEVKNTEVPLYQILILAYY